MAPTWYLGPIGGLRPLPVPEPDVEMSVVRYGGIHQGLSGARRMDITGFRQDFELQFTYMEREEWQWLEALYRRLIPGPFVLLNPMKKNRLPVESSFPSVGGGTARGALPSGGWTDRQDDWPEGVGVGGWCTRWGGRAGSAFFRTARINPAGIHAQEQVTVSAYLKATTPVTMNWIVDYYDRFTQPSASPYSPGFSVGTEWARFSYTVTPPAGIGAIDPVLWVGSTTSEISIAAVQVESGPVATEWEMGGGSTRVVIDQMPTSSPRFPLTDVSVILLEA